MKPNPEQARPSQAAMRAAKRICAEFETRRGGSPADPSESLVAFIIDAEFPANPEEEIKTLKALAVSTKRLLDSLEAVRHAKATNLNKLETATIEYWAAEKEATEALAKLKHD